METARPTQVLTASTTEEDTVEQKVFFLKSLGLYLLQLSSVFYFFCGTLLFSAIMPLGKRWKGLRPLCRPAFVWSAFRSFERWLISTGQFIIDDRALRNASNMRGTVVVANHPGLLDAFFLLSRMDNTVCVMRSGLQRNPFFGGASREMGYISNDAGHRFVREAERNLKEGRNLLLFPEGTRTLPGLSLNPFKKGFALAAIRSRAPVQCVFLRTSARYLGKGTSVLSRAPLPIHLHMEMGPVLTPAQGESAADFSSRVEKVFRDAM
jgi:1-acyl-sn-glycerol-3-phosphate acyltransferase